MTENTISLFKLGDITDWYNIIKTQGIVSMSQEIKQTLIPIQVM